MTEPSTEVIPSAWRARLSKFGRPLFARSVTSLLITATLFVLGWWAMYEVRTISYWLTLLLALPVGGLLIRLFIIFHDCAHGSYFGARVLNDFVGRILGVLTLTPFRFWRRHHLLHHATSGNLDRRGTGDVDTLTVDEYRARSRWGRAAYRVYRNPLVFLLIGPPYLFLFRHRLPIGMPLAWRKEWISVLLNNVAIAAAIVGLSLSLGLGPFLLVHAPLFMVSTMAGIWLFFVQHQFEGTYWRRDGRWNFAEACLSGSSLLDVPAPLRWVTANIEIHHIHHLCSAIPSYRLRKCMDEMVELPRPSRFSLWKSLRFAKLALWDEQQERLVGFRPARTSGARRS